METFSSHYPTLGRGIKKKIPSEEYKGEGLVNGQEG
jgi:hypothetical protein|tara:strand:+ start:292 stop:399 length:108 start_codon:yes stop_codon:yes gene_type:complete